MVEGNIAPVMIFRYSIRGRPVPIQAAMLLPMVLANKYHTYLQVIQYFTVMIPKQTPMTNLFFITYFQRHLRTYFSLSFKYVIPEYDSIP